MKTISYLDSAAKQNPHGIEAKKIHENDHVQTVHITLKPGEKLIKHSTPVDVFF
jgi:quercetin dioxygenase-like cupin family protein